VTALQVVVLLLVAATGAVVVSVREPLRQAMILGIYGLLLVVTFVVLQAPDVALSAAVVGAVAMPLMIALALAKIQERSDR